MAYFREGYAHRLEIFQEIQDIDFSTKIQIEHSRVLEEDENFTSGPAKALHEMLLMGFIEAQQTKLIFLTFKGIDLAIYYIRHR